jgi:predicted Zn-dependent protease
VEARMLGKNIVFIDNGEIIDYGSKEDVFNNPKNEKIRTILASVYFKEKNFPKVEQLLLDALSLKPDNVNAILVIAKFYNQTNQTDKAISFLTQHIEQLKNTPQVVNLRTALAEIYLRQKKMIWLNNNMRWCFKETPAILMLNFFRPRN